MCYTFTFIPFKLFCNFLCDISNTQVYVECRRVLLICLVLGYFANIFHLLAKIQLLVTSLIYFFRVDNFVFQVLNLLRCALMSRTWLILVNILCMLVEKIYFLFWRGVSLKCQYIDSLVLPLPETDRQREWVRAGEG